MSTSMHSEAHDIYRDLRRLIAGTEKEFVAMGASFHVSLKRLRKVYEERLEAGVRFTFVHLSKQADFGDYAVQFGQTVEELRTEVQTSYAVLDAIRSRYPDLIRSLPTKRCPNYRIYISDPHAERPPGIINFYGVATDSPDLPAFLVDDFRTSDYAPYFEDTLRAIERETHKRVFIIHGHGEAKWRELETLVRRLGLEPVVLVEQGGGAQTIIEKLERHAREVAVAMAVFTPDETVAVGGEEYRQPRPNAIFEAGWFSAHLGRRRVIILLQGDTVLPSDLHGVAQLRFEKKVSEVYADLERELIDLEII